MGEADDRLDGCRVLAALNGLELFGHERGNIEVFKVLRDLGAEVMVGVNGVENGGAVAAHLEELGFATFRLPFSNQWSWQWLRKHPISVFEKTWAVVSCSWRFAKVVFKFRPTHIHLGSSLAYSYLALALYACRLPLVFRAGDCPPIDSSFNFQIWRAAMKRTSRLICISDYVRTSVMRAGAYDASVIYNLAPSRTCENPDDRISAFDDPDTKLVYVGAVAEHKGLVPLVDAFARLLNDYPSLRLDIVGGSKYDLPFRHQLTQLLHARKLEGHVRLLGSVDDPSSCYRNAAVHVAPSVWDEPLGNVVLEAKCLGTPSIVFPSGGLPEMVRHQLDGYVCREKSAESLEEGLRWMLSDRARLARMGVAAREDSEKRFGAARFAREWANVYSGK